MEKKTLYEELKIKKEGGYYYIVSTNNDNLYIDAGGKSLEKAKDFLKKIEAVYLDNEFIGEEAYNKKGELEGIVSFLHIDFETLEVEYYVITDKDGTLSVTSERIEKMVNVYATEESQKIEKEKSEETAKQQKKIEEKEKKEAETKAKEKEEDLNLSGFEKTLTPMRAGKVLKTLNRLVKYEGKILKKKYWIKELLEKNYIPKKKMNTNRYSARKINMEYIKLADRMEYTILKEDGSGYDFSKTDFDFASYLIENNLIEKKEEY